MGSENEDSVSLLSSHGISDYGSLSRVTELEAVPPVTIGWKNIVVRAQKTGRLLLDNISGTAQSGKLTALMGASGAGKTTLLNTFLMRNLKNLTVEGHVTVNGVHLGSEITAVSGYVQQEELFLPTLTVKEHLNMQAQLRLPKDFSAERRKRRIFQVMVQLGLLRCQNTPIGVVGQKKGISGGEAKRLLFASELLNNPAILFCDEPTTGLDSFMAESVVKVLARLAHSGRTIICTIHQPASELYSMFDRVLFLAGGRTAFLGSPSRALEFLASCGYPCPDDYNPADMIIQALAIAPHEEDICKERIRRICNAYDESDSWKEICEELKGCEAVGAKLDGRSRAPLSTQIRVLLHRSFLDNLRNPSLAHAKILQKIVMGLFLGLLYFQTQNTVPKQVGIGNIFGALFFLVCELTYATLFGVLTFLPADFPLLVREYHDGMYGVAPYYFARALSYMPLFTLDGLLMLVISYWMIGLASTATQVLLTMALGLIIEQAAMAFGIMLSAVCPSYPVAVSIAGPFLTLISLTGGLYANVGELPSYISWVQYLSWFRYGFEALAINQWSVVTSSCENGTCAEADAILSEYSFKRANFVPDVLLICLSIFLFYVIGYVGLLFRVRRSR